MRSSNSLVAVDFFDECFPDDDDDLIRKINITNRIWKLLSSYFFLELDFGVSVVLFKLSIRSSMDLAFFVVDSSIVGTDEVGVKLDARAVRARKQSSLDWFLSISQ